jgi:hypothetical protein
MDEDVKLIKEALALLLEDRMKSSGNQAYMNADTRYRNLINRLRAGKW